ncbi:MAG: biotin transporter BioY [Clostridia bacterium]
MNRTSGFSVRTLVHAAMFTAVISVLSQIAIPMPGGVPITLQTLAIALCAYTLGWKTGLLSTITYVLLGAVGVPVFANFMGGFNVLIGVTGGFIWGFLPMTALCGLGMAIDKPVRSISMGIAGLLVCHAIGILQFSLVTQGTLINSAMVASLPYIIKDVVCVVGAYYMARVLRRTRALRITPEQYRK